MLFARAASSPHSGLLSRKSTIRKAIPAAITSHVSNVTASIFPVCVGTGSLGAFPTSASDPSFRQTIVTEQLSSNCLSVVLIEGTHFDRPVPESRLTVHGHWPHFGLKGRVG